MTVGRGCHETFTEIWRGGAEKVTNLASRLRELFDEPPSRLVPKTSLSTALKNDRCRRWRRASGPNHSVCDGKTGIGAGDNDIAVTNYLNAKGHDTPQDHSANTAPFSTWRALRATSSLIRCFVSRSFVRNEKIATTTCSPPSPSPLLNST